MFRSDLLKLSVTFVLVVATAFVSVASVAAAGSDTIRFVYPASVSPAVSRTAEASILADTTTDASLPSSLDNPNGYWMGPETVSAALSALDNSNGHWIGPGTVSAALSLLDDSNGHWIGPETVSAALGQLQP